MKNERLGDDAMKMTCDAAGPLVPSYLDGELSEAQASPLRAHLLDCPVCREKAKEGRVLARWFTALREEDEAAPTGVPTGFAARVARRAFAGDPGFLTPAPAREADLEEVPSLTGRRSLAPFLMAATAVAAALLFVLALAIQKDSLPRGNGQLEALPLRPPWLQEAPAPRAERVIPARPADPKAGSTAVDPR